MSIGGFENENGYDDNGQMLTATSGRYGNTVLFDYDDAGRLTDETLALSSQSYQTETTYDAASRVQSLTYPDGSVVERTYNSRGQLHTVEWNGNVVDTRTYDPRGLLQQSTYGNGVVTDFSYRDDGLVQSIATTNAGSQKVGMYAYDYDANKNKTSETITGAGVMNDYGFGQAQTAYDSEDRLTGWNRDDNQQNQTWQLSPVGDWNQFTENNQSTSFVHNDAHELTSVGNQGVGYDASGNQLQTAAGISLTWDQDNRLTAAGDHGFEYDALGRRVSINDSADTKILICAGQQLIATYAAGAPASSPSQTFVYGSYIDEPILLENGSQRYYLSRNQQFSVTALTDNAGAVVERYAYDAYGNTLILSDNGTARTASDLDNPFTFTGRYLHPEIDLLYFRARYYEPATGRFIGRDPLQYVDGMSLYRAYFVPNGVDPTGLEEWQIVVYAKAFGLGLTQGGANVVNGVQDGIIGIGNLPSATFNGGAYLVGAGMRAPYIPSPDWSEGLIVDEGGLHDVSKFAGGQGALTLITLGGSQLGAAGQLGHATKLTTVTKIQSSAAGGQLIGKAGIFALKNPSSSNVVNYVRTAGAKVGAVVPIRGAAASGFRPIPAVGPISGWTRAMGGYVLPARSLNLASGVTEKARLFQVARPFLVDMGVGVTLQGMSQTASGTINPLGVFGIPDNKPVQGIVIPATEFEVYIRPCSASGSGDLPIPFSK